MGPRCPHMPEDTFSHGAARLCDDVVVTSCHCFDVYLAITADSRHLTDNSNYGLSQTKSVNFCLVCYVPYISSPCISNNCYVKLLQGLGSLR